MVRVNENNGISQQKGSGKTPQNPEYMKKQMEYKSHIKEQAQNLDDLKNAAKWKQKQIELAKEYGDTKTAQILQGELDRINQDINKNTSVFNQK